MIINVELSSMPWACFFFFFLQHILGRTQQAHIESFPMEKENNQIIHKDSLACLKRIVMAIIKSRLSRHDPTAKKFFVQSVLV